MIYILIAVILFCVVRKPADLQDLAPGTHPPFVTFNGEVKVDVNKIEEFLEEKLTPPRYRTSLNRTEVTDFFQMISLMLLSH